MDTCFETVETNLGLGENNPANERQRHLRKVRSYARYPWRRRKLPQDGRRVTKGAREVHDGGAPGQRDQGGHAPHV